MLTASGAFDTTINTKVMTVAARLEIDTPAGPTGNFTATLRSVDLTAQNTTDLPDGVHDTAGFTNIGGTIVLAGQLSNGMSVADYFNPDNAASPIYRIKVKGLPVRFSFGVQPQGTTGPEVVRKLTGRLGAGSINHAQGEVTFPVVDLSADWNGVPSIPSVVTAPPYNAGLTSEFALDQIIRAENGDSSWPKTRPSCVLSAGMRSSIWPEVGRLDSAHSQPVQTFVPGAMGSALQITTFGGYIAYLLAAPVTTVVFIEFWYQGSDVAVTVGSPTDGVYLNGDVSLASVGAQAGGSASGTPGAGDLHYLAAQITLPAVGGNTYSGYINVDGYSSPFAFTAPTARAGAAWTTATVTMYDDTGSIEALQISTETAPASNAIFQPAAVIDPSLNPLTVVPPVDPSAKAWDVIQQIAAAELGYARRDEFGVFRFSNRQTLAAQPVARAVTADTSLKSLSTSIGGGTEARAITVPYTPWAFGAPTAVFTATTAIKAPRNRTTVFTQTLTALAANLDTTSSVLPNSHSSVDGGTWHRASNEAAGVTEHAGVTVTVTQATGNTVTVTVRNSTSRDAYLVTPSNYTDLAAGSPALWIGGTPATAGDEASVTVTYPPGDAPLTLTSNPYLQDHDTALAVGNFLLNQLFYPIRDFTDVDIVPDARLQVADIVHLQDPARSFIDEYAYVWGWSFNATFPPAGEDGGSWDMTLDVRALGPPGAWLLGIAGRSEFGVDTYMYA